MVTRPPRQVPPPTRPDGDPGRPNTYGRIIPREELSGFAAWSPGSLDGGQAPRRPPVSAPPPVQPPPPPPPPEPSLDELLHGARQSGYQDGYRDGMAALDAFKQSFAKQMSAQIGALVGNFDADLQALEQDMAATLARTAVELARQVVRNELSTRPELIADVAHDAVEALLVHARHVRVRVHPDDLPLVLDGAGEELRAREAQVVPDPAITRGGCKIDADICSVDATLGARWQQAAASLGLTSVWEDRRSAPEPSHHRSAHRHDLRGEGRPERPGRGDERLERADRPDRPDRPPMRGEERHPPPAGRGDDRSRGRSDPRDDELYGERDNARAQPRYDDRAETPRTSARDQGRAQPPEPYAAAVPDDAYPDLGDEPFVDDHLADDHSDPRERPRHDVRDDSRYDSRYDARYTTRFDDDSPA